jgi:hypothetical protein
MVSGIKEQMTEDRERRAEDFEGFRCQGIKGMVHVS